MLHIWSTYHDDIIWHYNNILITLTKIQACCTLRPPFDKFLTLFLTWVSPKASLAKIYVFTNMLITQAPRGPQTWFWMHSMWICLLKTMGYLPRPETHKNKSNKTWQMTKMQTKMDPKKCKSNVLKVQNYWILVNVMRILL